MVKRSKKYREAAEKVDRNNLYTANEAIALLKSMPAYNFDQTVEAVYHSTTLNAKVSQYTSQWFYQRFIVHTHQFHSSTCWVCQRSKDVEYCTNA